MLTREEYLGAAAAHTAASLGTIAGCLTLLFDQLADLEPVLTAEDRDETCDILSWLIEQLHREEKSIRDAISRPTAGREAA